MVLTESCFELLIDLTILFRRQRAGSASSSPHSIKAVDDVDDSGGDCGDGKGIHDSAGKMCLRATSQRLQHRQPIRKQIRLFRRRSLPIRTKHSASGAERIGCLSAKILGDPMDSGRNHCLILTFPQQELVDDDERGHDRFVGVHGNRVALLRCRGLATGEREWRGEKSDAKERDQESLPDGGRRHGFCVVDFGRFVNRCV